MTPEQLDAIKNRIPTTYGPPWTVDDGTDDDGNLVWHVLYATDDPQAGLVATVPDYGQYLAEFLAAARADIPALVAEVERLRAAGPAYVNADTGYHWLTCPACETPLHCIDGGDTLAGLFDAVAAHTCRAAETAAPADDEAADPADEIDEVTAAHVLWHYGATGGMEPGGFKQALIIAMDKADRDHQLRLAAAYPGYALAVHWAKNTAAPDENRRRPPPRRPHLGRGQRPPGAARPVLDRRGQRHRRRGRPGRDPGAAPPQGRAAVRQLLECARRLHWPRIHRGPDVTVCLRCWPCLVCGGTTTACLGWCASTRWP